MGTIAETLLEQGQARGLVKGRVEGRVEGRAEGKVETLTRLLECRFGPVPGDIRNRIAHAGLAEIDTWFDAAIDAPDLAAVFGAGQSR